MSSLTPTLYAAIPFFALLAIIAFFPLLGKNLWAKAYPHFSLGLAAVTTSYYYFFMHNLNPLTHAIYEYLSFMALIAALFIIAGGIHINFNTRSGPLVNTFFLVAGAIASNIVGTTGASMIFIRPYLRVNRHRINPYHIVFFIFIVSNMGGILTPVGDPPLFIGYLKGIPFFWPVTNLWEIWLFALSIEMIIFYLLDAKSLRTIENINFNEEANSGLNIEVSGIHNLLFLVIVLAAVFISRPPFLRELVMIGAAVGSYLTTKKEIHEKNEFTFAPVKEVSILFLGIFITMVPALEWICQNAVNIGLQTPGQFYWYTGALSSILDNTPTYLNFLSAASGSIIKAGPSIYPLIQSHALAIHNGGTHLLSAADAAPLYYEAHNVVSNLDSIAYNVNKLNDISVTYLLHTKNTIIEAISVGAVFFGAMTYIGNGPNFMVKKIAEEFGAECPSFINYILYYSIPILLPLFLLVWIIFFK